MIQRAELVRLKTDFTTFDYVKLIQKNLEPPYRLYVDFSMFCFESKFKILYFNLNNYYNLEVDPPKYKFQFAQRNCAFNKTILITDDKIKEKLNQELDVPDSLHMQTAFANHSKTLRWNNGSGLQPQMILSVHVWIERLSPTLMFDKPDSDDSDME